jgi:hypothetical protein
LDASAKVVSWHHLMDASESGKELLDDLEGLMGKKEYTFVKQSLLSKKIPTPSLLIKDHKKASLMGEFPTRLVVPAQNFTSAFPKLGNLAIRRILDSNHVDYWKRTIVLASDLKEKLESLHICRDDVTIISLDIEAMYPSIKFKHIQNAVEYFSSGLSERDVDTVNECLELICFGMENTLLTFQDQYYIYDRDQSLDEKGLTIGGRCDSAWLADLVAAYILAEVDEELFSDTTFFFGMYRDDGLVVFNSKKTKTQVHTWLNYFQLAVDELCGNSFLQFTAVMWQSDGRPSRGNTGKFSVDTNQALPYPDMEMYWSSRGQLLFWVHLKPNQQFLDLNCGSSHTCHVTRL